MAISNTFRAAALGSVSLLAIIPTARAQTASLPTANEWVIQDENASISTTSETDRYYVNGFNLGWTSPQGQVPGFISGLGHTLFGAGDQSFNIGLIQQLYTPSDTSRIDPDPEDEPYAGYLAAQFNLIQDTQDTRTVAGLSVGVVGRDAGGELVQNDFHAIIGQKGTHGWAYQLPSEPALDFNGSRIWRVPVWQSASGLEMEMLPQIGGEVGLTEDYIQPAVGFRFGSGLNSDFGPPLLNLSPSGGDAFGAARNVDWYVFGSAAGKLVGHDELLEGADFQTSRGVGVERAVGTFEAGAVVIWRGVRFSYVQVFQTNRFQHQAGTIHEFGSFSVGFTF